MKTTMLFAFSLMFIAATLHNAQAAGLGKCAGFMHLKEVKAADAKEKQMEKDMDAAGVEFDKFDNACSSLKVSNIDELKAAVEKFKAEAMATAPVAAKVRKSITDTYEALVLADKAMVKEGNNAGQPVPAGAPPRKPFNIEAAMACIGEIRADAPEVKKYLGQLDLREEKLKNCSPPVPAETGTGCRWVHDARGCGIGGCTQAKNGAWCRRLN